MTNLTHQLSESVLNKHECTMDQELTDATAYAARTCYVFTHQMAALFCMK